MTSTIRTYEDLLEEKERLKALLQTQKAIIRQDIDEIKQELAPVKSAIHFIGKITTKDPSNPLLTSTLDTVIDMVLRRFVLARAGWVTKFIVPFFVKNFSSHFIDEKKDTILRKIFSLFKGKKKAAPAAEANGKMHPVEEEEED